MADFYSSWVKENFNEDATTSCDQMAVDKRGLLNRIDTHTDHNSRDPGVLHFYLANFRPTWTDCTCEGYYAENFGMSLWSKPKDGDDVDAVTSVTDLCDFLFPQVLRAVQTLARLLAFQSPPKPLYVVVVKFPHV